MAAETTDNYNYNYNYNATCFHKHSQRDPPPLVQDGKLVLQTHHIGWIVAGTFALLASAISFWLVNKHLRHYTNKHEQRYIVRILFMVPIYALVSFASYLFWDQSTPLLLLRDCYESTVLTSFFYLLLLYLSSDPDEQRAIFLKVGLSKENDRKASLRGEPVKKWIFPLGSVKSKPADGLYFLQMMKWGVLQYCVVRPVTTLVAVILDYVGLYCEDSWSPGWGHVYIVSVVSISVSIAMYCLIQVYVPISKQLAPHKPLLKLFAIKAVVFLTFWQATFLSVLSTVGVVKDTEYMTSDDINIGIGAIIEVVEMTIFAILHIRAFSYKPYVVPASSLDHGARHGGLGARALYSNDVIRTPRMRSLLHAFDFRETLREIWVACVYVVRKSKGIETGTSARRRVIREDLFGGPQTRALLTDESARKKVAAENNSEFRPVPVAISVDVEKEVRVEDAQWYPGIADDYGLGRTFPRRERSADLIEQVDLELDRRGFASRVSGGHERGVSRTMGTRREGPQSSWWRRTLDRLSETSADDGICYHVLEGDALDRMSRQRGTNDDRAVLPEAPLEGIPVRGAQVASNRRHQPASSSVPYIVVGRLSEDTSVVPSASAMEADDVVLSRLFVNKANSETSGPSSQTHLSSRGHHIRLTVPASVVPAVQTRAVECKSAIKDADLHVNPSGSETGYTFDDAHRSARSFRAEVLTEDRPGRHRREQAYHRQAEAPPSERRSATVSPPLSSAGRRQTDLRRSSRTRILRVERADYEPSSGQPLISEMTSNGPRT